jgi:hypothetical protein
MGVFASRAIDAGEVVEIAPVIQLHARFAGFEPALQRSVFNWESLAQVDGVSAIALGYGSMYNHANPANMRYLSALDGAAIEFVAVRAIRAGEELTINYCGKAGAPVSDNEGWFEACGVVPIRNGSGDNV